MATVPEPLIREHHAEMEQAVERERRRLADALHDTTVQQLVLARILLDLASEDEPGSAGRLEQVRSWLDDSLAQVRSLVWALTPGILREAGLVPALDSLCEHLGARWHLRYRCHVTGEIPPALSDAESDRSSVSVLIATRLSGSISRCRINSVFVIMSTLTSTTALPGPTRASRIL